MITMKPDKSFLLRLPMPDDDRLVTVKFQFEIASSTKLRAVEAIVHVIYWGPTAPTNDDNVASTVVIERNGGFQLLSGPSIPESGIAAIDAVLNWDRE